MTIIYCDLAGAAQGVLETDSAEFETGIDEGSNTWTATVTKEMYAQLPEYALIFCLGTEFGGLYARKDINTKLNTLTVGGLTWRGVLQRCIVSYPNGLRQDLTACIDDVLRYTPKDPTTQRTFIKRGSESIFGVDSNWRGARHLSAMDALDKIFASAGYRMKIRHTQKQTWNSMRDMAAFVLPVPIQTISDNTQTLYANVNYNIGLEKDFINHLICLGSGTEDAREIIHLYVDENGVITQTAPSFSADLPFFREAIFDYPGAESAELLQYGTRRLQELIRPSKSFGIELYDGDTDIGIWDIVKCHDKITGLTLSAPVVGKVLKIKGGTDTVEYIMGDVATEATS